MASRRCFAAIILVGLSAHPSSRAEDRPSFGYVHVGDDKDHDHSGVAVSRDGRLLAIGGRSSLFKGGFTIYDIRAAKKLRQVDLELGHCGTVCFSHDGTLLAVGGHGGTLAVVRVADGKTVAQIAGHRDDIQHVEFTPDDKRLVSTGYDCQVRVWDADGWKPMVAIRFDPEDRRLKKWKEFPEDDHEKAPVTVEIEGKVKNTYHFDISPDGKHIAVGGAALDVKIIELSTGKVAKTIPSEKGNRVFGVRYSADGKCLAMGGCEDTGLVEVRSVEDGKQLFRAPKAHNYTVLCLALSRDSKYLLSGGLEDGHRLWNLETGKLIRHRITEVPNQYARFGSKERAIGLGFLPDNDTYYYANAHEVVRFFSVKTGKEVSPITKKD